MKNVCAKCHSSKKKLVDISNHELRRLTMSGGFFKPRYFICECCYKKIKENCYGN